MSVDPDLDRVKILELDFSGEFERIAKPIDIVHSRLHFFNPSHDTHTHKNGDHIHYSKEFAIMIATMLWSLEEKEIKQQKFTLLLVQQLLSSLL